MVVWPPLSFYNADMQKTLITIEKCRIENNRATLVPELSWEMKEGEVWLVTGPNGSGKADFFRIKSVVRKTCHQAPKALHVGDALVALVERG